MQVGLYIHIPFCESKCYYCDFLSFPKKQKQVEYVDALVKEIENYGKSLDSSIAVKSIFIGGGTPTVLPPFLLDKIAKAITKHFRIIEGAEWTIEANPGTLSLEHIEVIRNYPINRISLGLQSTHNDLLKAIGRRHILADWEKSIDLLRTHTHCAINTDLMFALPGQTLEQFEDTLKTVASYNLEHLSAYALIIEEGTRFGNLYDEGKMKEVDEALDRQMYHLAQSFLREQGYTQYEISNWAKPGYECQHNIVYWRRAPYLGLGLGAHALFENIRYYNEEDLEAYLKAHGDLKTLRHIEEVVTKESAMSEYMFLGLRLLEGVSYKAFNEVFGQDLEAVYGDQIKKWIKQGVLVKHKDYIRLTEYGLDVCNEVFVSFL